jgi:hypothetical protein
MFNGVVISLHKTNEAAVEMLKSIGAPHTTIAEHQARPSEATCDGCKGTMRPEQLFEGKCICCWAEKAKSIAHG